MSEQKRPPVYYSEYLQLDKILNAQFPESAKENKEADDEMLFIIIHQTYELWFKQILHELKLVRNVFLQTNIPDNSPQLYNCVRKLKRVVSILNVAVKQMDILETMTPLDFLDFRDLLRPASGFQSIQFKMVEAILGLKYENRFGKEYYISQLNNNDVDKVKDSENEKSLLVLINNWLERMPFLNNMYGNAIDSFWNKYSTAYIESLSENEKQNIETFNTFFINKNNFPTGRSFSFEAGRNALFIMLYRDYPKLQFPYELLNTLLEIDEGLAMWRYKHIQMVQRTIGKRVGTGGSTGAQYLQGAAEKHSIFKELSELTSFLLPRHLLPELSKNVVDNILN